MDRLPTPLSKCTLVDPSILGTIQVDLQHHQRCIQSLHTCTSIYQHPPPPYLLTSLYFFLNALDIEVFPSYLLSHIPPRRCRLLTSPSVRGVAACQLKQASPQSTDSQDEGNSHNIHIHHPSYFDCCRAEVHHASQLFLAYSRAPTCL